MTAGASAPDDAMVLVAAFAAHVRDLDAVAELGAPLARVVRALGFAHHALAEHVDPARLPAGCLFLHDYPVDWVDRFTDAAMYRVDPVRQVASRRVGGFGWRELPGLLTLSPDQAAVMAEAGENGLCDGFTVPLHAPGPRAASCSFVSAPGASLPEASLAAAEWLAHVAFGAVHRLRGSGDARLTPRQRQCVALVAEGKTDWEIGVILGLSEETVGKYLDAARLRFGVARRTQLVVAALCSGEIDSCTADVSALRKD